MGTAIPRAPYEVPDVEHSGSAPPSEPPPARARTESFPALEGPAEIGRATRIAEACRRDLRRLEAIVGTLPTAVTPNGTGALGVIFTQLSAFGEKLDGLADGLAADREERARRDKAREAETTAALALTERRRAPWSRALWIVVTAVLGCVTVGACGMLGAYVALHWRSDVSAPQQPERPR